MASHTAFIALLVLVVATSTHGHSHIPQLAGHVKFCPYVVYYEYTPSKGTVDFVLSGSVKDNQYIAMAFSHDKLMQDDSVMACILFGNNVGVEYFHIPNIRQSNPQHLAGKESEKTIEFTEYKDGVLRCHFSRPATPKTPDPKIFDLTKNTYHLFFAIGPSISKQEIGYHTSKKISDAKINFTIATQTGSVSGGLDMVKAHACLMLVAWILCSSIAVVLARHYKKMWPNTLILEKAVWFQVHRGLLVLALTCTCISFIIIFVHVDGYSMAGWTVGSKELHRAHPMLGIIVTALCLINPIMALFRPGPTDSTRPIFNWAHFGVGTLARASAVVTIFIGFDMTLWISNGLVVMGVFLAYEVAMEIVMEVLTCTAKAPTVENPEDLELKPVAEPKTALSKVPPPQHKLKNIMLIAHCVIVSIFTVALVVVVATGGAVDVSEEAAEVTDDLCA